MLKGFLAHALGTCFATRLAAKVAMISSFQAESAAAAAETGLRRPDYLTA